LAAGHHHGRFEVLLLFFIFDPTGFCQAEDKNNSIFYSVGVADILSICSSVIYVSSNAQQATCIFNSH